MLGLIKGLIRARSVPSTSCPSPGCGEICWSMEKGGVWTVGHSHATTEPRQREKAKVHQGHHSLAIGSRSTDKWVALGHPGVGLRPGSFTD